MKYNVEEYSVWRLSRGIDTDMHANKSRRWCEDAAIGRGTPAKVGGIKNMLSLRAVAQPTPWFGPTDTDFGILDSRIVQKYVSIVF